MSWRNRHNIATLAGAWNLNGNVLDSTGKYPGTAVNAPTYGSFLKGGQAIEFDGNNQYVNVGDVVELNAVPQFTICFWMNQDVIDQDDYIFEKRVDATHQILIIPWSDGEMYFDVTDGTGRGHFDYSTAISAGAWAHVAMVFDGTQIGDANRLIVYVDSVPQTLAFTSAMPATAPDLSGQDATIGRAANSFDGRLRDMRIYSCSLSRDEVRGVIDQAVPIF